MGSGDDEGHAHRAVPRPRRRGHLPPPLRRTSSPGSPRAASARRSSPARCSTSTASATARSTCSRAGWSSSSTASPARTSTSPRPTAARSSATSRSSPASRRSAPASPPSRRRRSVFDRAGLRAMVARWPEFGELIFRTLLERRNWHEREGYGVMRLIAPRGSRRAFEVRDLLERNLLPRPLVRRRHRRGERAAPRLARHPARGDAGPRPRHQRHAQPLRRAGRAVAGPARRRRGPALRPRRARRRAGRPRGGRVRRLRGPEDLRRRGLGARRPGRAPAPGSRTTSASRAASPART